jgi:transposase
MHDDTPAYAGIDWATRAHAVCVIAADGSVLEEFEIGHERAGIETLRRRLVVLGVARAAIERPDGPVVEMLVEGGFDVVVVPPRVVKSLRSRYSLAGNKSDRSDAFMLADVLRTDGHRLRALEPDSEATRALRCAVRTRKELVGHRVALVQQLEAHLERAFPGGSCGKDPAVLFGRLRDAPDGLRGPEAELLGVVTLALVSVIEGVAAQIAEIESRIAEALAAHRLAPVFQSLPRSGTVRAASLLVEIGDCKARLPTAESLACLAGVAPSTRASGQHHAVVHRFASDKWLKNALCDFAQDSVRANAWANDLYRRARARGLRHPHAVRVLARAWCYVIWRCWQDETPYDPSVHRGAQRLLEAA